MNKTILATLVTNLLLSSSAHAQQPGVTRIDLQRHDLSIVR